MNYNSANEDGLALAQLIKKRSYWEDESEVSERMNSLK